MIHGEELVARRVMEMREARGWTQTQMADEMKGIRKINQSSISKIEALERKITVDNLLAFAEVFNTTPEHLLRTDGDDEAAALDEKLHQALTALAVVRSAMTNYDRA